MTVYVVTEHPYREESNVLGVYTTLEAAEKSLEDVMWKHEGHSVRYKDRCVSEGIPDTEDNEYQICEREVQE